MSTLHIQDAHDHEHPPPPMPALYAAVALVLISLVSTAWVRWFAEPADPTPLSPVVVDRQLSVLDLPEGLVEIRDAETDVLIVRYDVGEGAFARSTFRSLAHARQRLGADNRTPFLLEQRESGRLRLIDPVTERVLELWAFGPDNARAFAAFLETPPETGTATAVTESVAHTATRSNENER